MKLLLKNIRTQNVRWDRYTLLPASAENESTSKVLFETDQIEFELECPPDVTSARLFIGDADIYGGIHERGEKANLIRFKPRRNSKFGYDALFLHYCGIANISVVTWNEAGHQERLLFESINVCGRKVTAERIENILRYLSDNLSEELLIAFSPTQYSATLANNGVALADRLQRLEHTLNDVDGTLRNIMHRPLKSLRPTVRTLKAPTQESLQAEDMEWVLENAGQAIEADGPESALFHASFKWRSMEEVESTAPVESTNIQENHLIRFYLRTLRATAVELLSECAVGTADSISYQSITTGEGDTYRNFYSISNRLLTRLSAGYSSRAERCLGHCEHLIRQFDIKVPTQHSMPKTLRSTQKIRANRSYMLMMRQMHDWLEKKEVIWLEKVILSSINSTWKLFEYYTVMCVNSWLNKHGANQGKGLFSGVYLGHNVALYYEPSWPVIGRAVSGDSIVIADRDTSCKRTPDIVIDVNSNSGDRHLLILDAKCRQESNVWRELHSCEKKYINPVRDLKGHCPVKSVIMLYPAVSGQSDRSFQDYYMGPFSLFDQTPAQPHMGIQRINISVDGWEPELDRTLRALMEQVVS